MRRGVVAMLFDLSMTELMLIGVVALVVIGPKDLPRALRVAGFWVKKARTLSREFQSSVDQMIREAELDEMRQELKKEFRNTIDPTGSLAEGLKPPELPKFSEADLPATPETRTLPATEVSPQEMAEPAAPETHALPVTEVSPQEIAEPATPTAGQSQSIEHDFVPPKP